MSVPLERPPHRCAVLRRWSKGIPTSVPSELAIYDLSAKTSEGWLPIASRPSKAVFQPAPAPAPAPPLRQLNRGMKHDYAGVVERLERLRAPLDYAWGVMSHLKNVKDSKEFRKVYRELQV